MAQRRKEAKVQKEQKDTPAQLSLFSRIGINLSPTRQREIFGVLVLFLGIITLLTLTGFTRGTVGDLWANALRTLFGWGAFALPVAAFAASYFLIRRGEANESLVSWGRVFAAEIFFAVVLALADLIVAPKIDDLAKTATGGGFVGYAISWGLAQVIGTIGTGIVLGLLGLIALVGIMGLSTEHLRTWSNSLLERVDQPTSTLVPRPERIKADEPVVSVPKPRFEPPSAPVRAVPEKSPVLVRPAFGTKPPMKTSGQPILTPRGRARKRTPQLPSLELFDPSNEAKYGESDAKRKGDLIIETLASFGIPAKIVEINAGPTITQFGLEPGFVDRRTADGEMRQRKVSVNRIAALQHDLELALAAAPIRIETPVPGRPIVGIEVPNHSISVVSLRGVMESDAYKKKKTPLRIALGRDVSGVSIGADLGSMPHLLIAGATGSGKSVCINAIIACLLIQNSPDDLRFVMIDPKRVELVNFNGVPHLLGPVIVNTDEVVACLRWLAREMDNRFTLFAKEKVRNIDAFNDKMNKNGGDTMPFIIALIDELADLMLSAPEETEKLLTRLAQMARATGIHLVIATQRPSVDVVTGLIKANFPSRISFAVTSSIDSRVVLDMPGAEKLLGKGDMLYMASDSSKLSRLQGCFVSDDELARLVHFWREKAITDMRDIATEPPWKNMGGDAREGSDDALIQQALQAIRQYDRTSISFLQRKLGIGYPRAARLMDQLEEHGIVGPDEGGGKSRPVLAHDLAVKNFEAEESPKKKK